MALGFQFGLRRTTKKFSESCHVYFLLIHHILFISSVAEGIS